LSNGRIEKFGQVFRWITPILVTIALFVLTQMSMDIGKIESKLEIQMEQVQTFMRTTESRLSVLEDRIYNRGYINGESK